MKKIYQTPVTVLFNIGTTRILMGSVEDGFNPKGDVPETEETSGNLSRRRRDVWDDEEDEDNY